MDLVDEEDIALLEAGEDRRHVAFALERGPGDRAKADAELLAHDEGEARLPEPGRADQQQVVESLRPALGRRERDAELLLDALLADELVEAAGTERPLELVLVRPDRRREELRLFGGGAHAARFSAWRTRSSGGASGSVPVRASSASGTE